MVWRVLDADPPLPTRVDDAVESFVLEDVPTQEPGPERTLRREIRCLENDLAERLGAVVHIEPGRQGAGRIVIRYSTLDQLDGIVERFGIAKA